MILVSVLAPWISMTRRRAPGPATTPPPETTGAPTPGIGQSSVMYLFRDQNLTTPFCIYCSVFATDRCCVMRNLLLFIPDTRALSESLKMRQKKSCPKNKSQLLLRPGWKHWRKPSSELSRETILEKCVTKWPGKNLWQRNESKTLDFKKSSSKSEEWENNIFSVDRIFEPAVSIRSLR